MRGRNVVSVANMCERHIATLCQLLRPHLHPLRALVPLPEFPLVLRQATHDGLQTAVVQRHLPSLELLLLPLAMGHLPIDPRVPGRMGGTALRPSHQELQGSVRARRGDDAVRGRL